MTNALKIIYTTDPETKKHVFKSQYHDLQKIWEKLTSKEKDFINKFMKALDNYKITDIFTILTYITIKIEQKDQAKSDPLFADLGVKFNKKNTYLEMDFEERTPLIINAIRLILEGNKTPTDS